MSHPAARAVVVCTNLLAIVALLAVSLLALDPPEAAAASTKAPAGLKATATTSTTLTLTWNAVAEAPGYRVKYSTSSKMKKAGFQRDVGTTTTLTGLVPGQKYYVKIRTVSTTGRHLSKYSKTIKTRTLAKDPVSGASPTPTPSPAGCVPATTTHLNLPAKPSVLLVGDSYSEGIGAVPLRNGYAYKIAEPLGWTLTLDGKGGSGYVNPTSYGAGIFADRLPRHPADAYDLVVLQGSSNDQRYTAPEVEANLTKTLRLVRERYPHAQVLMLGPTTPYGSPSSTLVRVNDQLKAAAVSCGAVFVDPIAERWFVRGDGTWAANPDNGHPSNAGHERIASRFVADVRALS